MLREKIEKKFPSDEKQTSFGKAAQFLIQRKVASGTAEMAKQLRRALGPQPSRRVLTRNLHKYFRCLLSRQALDQILAIDSANRPSIKKVRQADWARESVEYMGLKEKGLYVEAMSLAQRLEKQARLEKDSLQALTWKTRECSCFRALGRLNEALPCGKDALTMFGELPAKHRSLPEALLIRLQLKFGVTIASVTMQAANFARGLSEHKKIEKEAHRLATRFKGSNVSREASFYVLHARRQQTECLRYLGRYQQALNNARELERTYPDGDTIPIFWARVYQADNLRLLGRYDEARALLLKLEELTELRRQLTSPLAVLWRRLALESVSRTNQTNLVVKRIREHLVTQSPDSLWGVSYAHLALASLYLDDAAQCTDHIEAFRKACEGNESTYVLEEGYSFLILAEMERGRGARDEFARKAYSKALECFQKGCVTWGVVRAQAGLHIVADVRMPKAPRSLEGNDQVLIDAVRTGRNISVGMLCCNFP